jgi:hypothetical protein
MEFESEVVNMFFLAVAMPCAMIYRIVVVFFGQGAMTMCFRLIRNFILEKLVTEGNPSLTIFVTRL